MGSAATAVTEDGAEYATSLSRLRRPVDDEAFSLAPRAEGPRDLCCNRHAFVIRRTDATQTARLRHTDARRSEMAGTDHLFRLGQSRVTISDSAIPGDDVGARQVTTNHRAILHGLLTIQLSGARPNRELIHHVPNQSVRGSASSSCWLGSRRCAPAH